MAKHEAHLNGEFDLILKKVEDGILNGSISASLEDKSNYITPNVKLAVRVFERYSYTGGNRVSMNVTLLEENNGIFLSAIASGGSQAMFLKINTFGEEAFLDKLIEIIHPFKV